MARQERWYFTKEELENSPSRKCGIDSEKELSYRQQAANLIQDMGQKLQVKQLVINTAIVYMHRFYTQHSFTRFHRNSIASCALFLAAKVEEQHRKLEHVIKASQICLSRENVNIPSEQFQALQAELVHHENLMLRTLGFDLSVEHPHTYIVNCFDLLRANKNLAQASYVLATNSLHLTTMCLRYKPTVVACICVYFVCKWASFEIPRSTEGRDWWTYVDPTVTQETLEKLTAEFISIFNKSPSRLKKILSSSDAVLPNSPSTKQLDRKRITDNQHQSHNNASFNKSQNYQQQHHNRTSSVPSSSSLQKVSPKDARFSSSSMHANNSRSSIKQPQPSISSGNNQTANANIDHPHHHHHHSHQSHTNHQHHHHTHHQPQQYNSEQQVHHHSSKQSQSNVAAKQQPHQQHHSMTNSSAKIPSTAKNPALLESSSSAMEKMKKDFIQNVDNHMNNNNVTKSNSSVISSSNNNNNNHKFSSSNNVNNDIISHSNMNNSNISNNNQSFSDSIIPNDLALTISPNGSEFSDYSQTKKDTFSDFKMEFSDNEDSTNAFNCSIPGLMSSVGGGAGGSSLINDGLNEDSRSNFTNPLEFSNTIGNSNIRPTMLNNVINPVTNNTNNNDSKQSLSSLNESNVDNSSGNNNPNQLPPSLPNFMQNSKVNVASSLLDNKNVSSKSNTAPIFDTTLGTSSSNTNLNTSNNDKFNIETKSSQPSQSLQQQSFATSIGSIATNHSPMQAVTATMTSIPKTVPHATAAFNQLINETSHSSQPPSLLIDDELSKHSSSLSMNITHKHHKEKHKHHKEKHKHKDKHHHKHKHKKDRNDEHNQKHHHHHHHQNHHSSASNNNKQPLESSSSAAPSFALINDTGDRDVNGSLKVKIRKHDLSTESEPQQQSPSTAAPSLKMKINLKARNISLIDDNNQQQGSNKKRKH